LIVTENHRPQGCRLNAVDISQGSVQGRQSWGPNIWKCPVPNVANVARMNVKILSQKVCPGKRRKVPTILSLARCAIIPPEVFCDVKNAPNFFSVGAPPWTLLRELTTLPRLPNRLGRGILCPHSPTHSTPAASRSRRLDLRPPPQY